MDPKSLLSTMIFPLGTFIILLSSRAVDGCVNFFAEQGQTVGGGSQDTYLDAKLWDTDTGSFVQVCTLSSNPPYNFLCKKGYSASVNSNSDGDYVVRYSTPHGPFQFSTDHIPCGAPGTHDGYSGKFCDQWKSCEYGCPNGSSDCFVYSCLAYGDCNSPPGL